MLARLARRSRSNPSKHPAGPIEQPRRTATGSAAGAHWPSCRAVDRRAAAAGSHTRQACDEDGPVRPGLPDPNCRPRKPVPPPAGKAAPSSPGSCTPGAHASRPLHRRGESPAAALGRGCRCTPPCRDVANHSQAGGAPPTAGPRSRPDSPAPAWRRCTRFPVEANQARTWHGSHAGAGWLHAARGPAGMAAAWSPRDAPANRKGARPRMLSGGSRPVRGRRPNKPDGPAPSAPYPAGRRVHGTDRGRHPTGMTDGERTGAGAAHPSRRTVAENNIPYPPKGRNSVSGPPGRVSSVAANTTTRSWDVARRPPATAAGAPARHGMSVVAASAGRPGEGVRAVERGAGRARKRCVGVLAICMPGSWDYWAVGLLDRAG